MTTRTRLLAVACGASCAALLAAPRAARAYRPFTGTDADVSGLGDVELEIGPVGYLHAAGRDALVAPALIANWGFAHDFELVLEGRNLVPLDPAPGEARAQLLDTQLDLKWVARDGALQDRSGPSIATEASVLLPETGATRPGGELTAIVSERWPAFAFHVNGAAALTRAQRLGLFGGLILEGPHAWPVRPVAEGFVDWAWDGARELSGLGGAIWQPREWLTFDAALRLARLHEPGGPDTRATEVRVGLTWAFIVG